MKRTLAALLALLLLVAPLSAQDQTPVADDDGTSPSWKTAMESVLWEESDLGQTAIIPMRNAPFPHSSRAEGYTTTQGKVFPRDPHYVDNSVAVFIPKGFQADRGVNLLFYFHGHSSSIDRSLPIMQLREKVRESGKNVILVFPEGPKMAPDSTIGRLEEQGAFARLANEVLDLLRSEGKIPADANLGQVLLSGHSGAYRALSFAVERGGIEEHIAAVFLLDASYGRNEQFIAWMERNPDGFFRSIYTEHLSDENEAIMAVLKGKGIPYLKVSEAEVTPEQLRTEPRIFLSTERSHNGAVEVLLPFLKEVPVPAE